MSEANELDGVVERPADNRLADITAHDGHLAAARLHVHLCFWCEQLAFVHVEGVSLCADHAKCAGCGKFVLAMALTCRCERYGAAGHEELVFCREACLEATHERGEMEEA